MGLETVTYISDLNPLWPLGSDPKSNGDNHVRNLKSSLLNTFAAITGPVTVTQLEINYLSGVTSNVQVQLNAKAPQQARRSPALSFCRLQRPSAPSLPLKSSPCLVCHRPSRPN